MTAAEVVDEEEVAEEVVAEEVGNEEVGNEDADDAPWDCRCVGIVIISTGTSGASILIFFCGVGQASV